MDKINVCGVDYKIIEQEIVDNDPLTFGLTTYANSRISIKKRLSIDRKKQTLLHELVHAIAHEAGFDDQNEEFVDRFSRVLYQVLKENSLTF